MLYVQQIVKGGFFFLTPSPELVKVEKYDLDPRHINTQAQCSKQYQIEICNDKIIQTTKNNETQSTHQQLLLTKRKPIDTQR